MASTGGGKCTGKVALSDDFRQIDSSWGVDSDKMISIEEGHLAIKPDMQKSDAVLYAGSLFGDADICVKVSNPDSFTQANGTSAGIEFWAADYANNYLFLIGPDGTAGLYRRVKGNSSSVISPRKMSLINTQSGGANALQVSTRGNAVTLYVNGVTFATVHGQPPQDGGEVGLYAESEHNQVDTWKFTDFKVAKPPT